MIQSLRVHDVLLHALMSQSRVQDAQTNSFFPLVTEIITKSLVVREQVIFVFQNVKPPAIKLPPSPKYEMC